jgi:hypothetical protein
MMSETRVVIEKGMTVNNLVLAKFIINSLEVGNLGER